MTDRLLFTPQSAVFYGSVGDNDVHKHYAAQLTLSFRYPFTYVDDACEQSSMAMVTPSNRRHCINSRGRALLVLLLDPLSPSGRALQQSGTVDRFSSDVVERAIDLIQGFRNEDDLGRTFEDLLGTLSLHGLPTNLGDSRIDDTLAYLRENSQESVSVDHLAQRVCLSTGRLQHLFKEHTGVSLLQYLRWERMKTGIALAGSAFNLTSSAHSAGFSDSAHLSREFKKMFGLTPFRTLKDSRTVQVFLDSNL